MTHPRQHKPMGQGSIDASRNALSAQLQSAPIGAMFICRDLTTDKARALARELRRNDIRIMPLRSLDNAQIFAGIELSALLVDVDIANVMTPKQYATLNEVRERIAVVKGGGDA